MVAFGIIGVLILVLIFVITRNQNAQGEFKQIKHAHKILQSQNKYSLDIIMIMSAQLQQAFQAKLVALNGHGLITKPDYDAASFILKKIQFILTQCCQHGETVEVAVNVALKGQDLSIEQISQFIARQPVDVRMSWGKNTAEGFITACKNIVSDPVQTEAED